MTKEQKEVFDALNSDNEDGIYEKLVYPPFSLSFISQENDFVDLANDGEEVIIKPSKEKLTKKVSFNLEEILDEHIQDRNLVLPDNHKEPKFPHQNLVEIVRKDPNQKYFIEDMPNISVKTAPYLKEYLERPSDEDDDWQKDNKTIISC